MKKRILSLLLAVCLCVALLPVAALAETDYGVWVQGTPVSSGYLNDVLLNGYNRAQYDPASNTLTLKNAQIVGRTNLGGIHATTGDTFTIRLEGQNKIKLEGDAFCGISVNPVDSRGGNLKITGDGSLTIEFDTAQRDTSFALGAYGSCTIDSGVSVTATAPAVTKGRYQDSRGALIGGDLVISGELTATGGSVTNVPGGMTSYGVSCSGNVIVNVGGELTATGGAAGDTVKEANALSCGVWIGENLTVNGTVKATGGSATSQTNVAESYGVKADGNIAVNGTLTANGGQAYTQSDSMEHRAESYGVLANEITVAAGGELTGNGGSAKSQSSQAGAYCYGVYANGDAIVNGTLKGNGGAAENTGSATSCGVVCQETLTVSGATATLTAKSPDPVGGVAAKTNTGSAASYGLRVNELFTASNGATVTAEAGTAQHTNNYGESDSIAFSEDRKIVVQDPGTRLYAKGGTAGDSSVGISVYHNAMTITGGEVEGIGGAAETSHGIYLSSHDVQAKEAIILNGGKLIANGEAATQVGCGLYGMVAANINAGTVACTGKTYAVLMQELNIGSDGKHVDFTAKATGASAVAAIYLIRPSGEPELTLTNAQIVTPTAGKISVASIEETPIRTILDANNEIAMDVHIVSEDATDEPEDTGNTDVEDETLPGWLTPVIGAVNAPAFGDVNVGDWFYDAVRYVSEYGLMTGTADNQFSPNAPVTRGMVMTILARCEGIRTDRYSPWYAAGVEWAKSVGISDGTNPEEAITREQLAVMLYRYAQYKGYDLNKLAELAFIDAAEISDYATIGLRWAVGNGIMSGAAGLESGKLLPQSTATRAQLAAMLQRFFG